MATQGNWTWIDRALQKIADGTILLNSHTFHMVLLGSGQAVSATFAGGSGDARYADLSAELATANGYTAGGVAMSSTALSRPSVSQVNFSSAVVSWTLTGSITYKYAAIVDWSATNKDILGFMDTDTGGGTISPVAGLYALNPDPLLGWLYWQQ
jgi:hypothetical protein